MIGNKLAYKPDELRVGSMTEREKTSSLGDVASEKDFGKRRLQVNHSNQEHS
jgi:hypothetical protein